MPATTFATFFIDSPWPEEGGGKIKRGASRHFKTMKPRDILRTIFTCPIFLPAENSHLYLCATNNYVPHAISFLPYLGFEYKTMLTWVKDEMGLGQYFRGETEQIIFATRGRGFAVKTDRKDLTTRIFAPVPRYEDGPKKGQKIHSAKPEALYERIEQRSFGPYAELFARHHRVRKTVGDREIIWTGWGDELK